jgi:hypothetical protein
MELCHNRLFLQVLVYFGINFCKLTIVPFIINVATFDELHKLYPHIIKLLYFTVFRSSLVMFLSDDM